MSERGRIDGPWYVHSWPWFIVCLLGTTVMAGLTTVYIAVEGADSIVVDDYYKAGKAINLALERDREAALREAQATVQFDTGIEIELEILGELPAGLTLELSHVTRKELDRRFELERTAEGRYAAAAVVPEGRYYATLRPLDGGTWRLRRRVQLPVEGAAVWEPSG